MALTDPKKCTGRAACRLLKVLTIVVCLLPCSIVSGEEDEAATETAAEPKRVFGPDPSEPRRTLFQWSYGTSFSGPTLDDPIMTDRPDFTEASSTVGKNVFQIETGYTFAFDRDGGDRSKSHSFPEALFRYGVFEEWLELRLATNFAGETFNSDSNSGMEDIYLGAKFMLTPQEGILPEMSLVPQMTVPTGARALTADRVLPGLNWLYGWDITDKISTAGSTQFNHAIDDATNRTYTEWAQAWTVGYSLGENVGAYTEFFGLYPHGADSVLPQHYFNGGFTFRFTKDVQLDLRAGKGLNPAAFDYFVGSGFSVRFH